MVICADGQMHSKAGAEQALQATNAGSAYAQDSTTRLYKRPLKELSMQEASYPFQRNCGSGIWGSSI